MEKNNKMNKCTKDHSAQYYKFLLVIYIYIYLGKKLLYAFSTICTYVDFNFTLKVFKD